MAKPKSEIYSLRRYLDENGVPDYSRIFNQGESKLWIRNHIDPWFLEHMDSQPDIVREDRHINKHLQDCEECRNKNKKETVEGQIDLPLNSG